MTPERIVSADGRLLLERIGIDRARALLAASPDVLDPLTAAPGWPTPHTADGVRHALSAAGTDLDTPFLVVEAASRVVVGDCGWHGPPGPTGEVEIGYGLAASVHGRGLGTAMVGTLTDWSLRQPGVERLIAETAPDNLPSRRSLERAGFELDEVLADVVRYVRARTG